MGRKDRMNSGKPRKPPVPVVGAALHEMRTVEDYVARYDCPWCGHEHMIRMNTFCSVEVHTDCGHQIRINRVEEMNRD